MSVIVTDRGFAPDDWTGAFALPEPASGNVAALDLSSDTDPDQIPLHPTLRLVRVDFPSSSDGRGFSIARRLRLRGFTGRLRARGHILADQYAMARRAGFDEVEIDDALAARQPEPQWRARANWQAHDYQSRLRG